MVRVACSMLNAKHDHKRYDVLDEPIETVTPTHHEFSSTEKHGATSRDRDDKSAEQVHAEIGRWLALALVATMSLLIDNVFRRR